MLSHNVVFVMCCNKAAHVLILLTIIAPAWAQSSHGCLYYGPEVKLAGTIVAKTYPGPPEYESIRKGDEPETYWLLVLAEPICMNEDRPNFQPAYRKVRRIQMVFENEKVYNKYRALLGKQVIASGTLYAAINIHHKTRVLLTVSTLAKAK